MSNGNQGLQALNDLLERQRQSQEADKNRGLQLLQMRLSELEAGKQRAYNTALTMYGAYVDIQKSYNDAIGEVSKMGVVLDELNNLENKSGNATAIVEESMFKKSDNISGMEDIIKDLSGSIGSYRDKIGYINRKQAEYADIFFNKAPEMYDMFKALEKGGISSKASMSDVESAAAIEFMKEKYNFTPNKNQLAALRSAFKELEKGEFAKLATEEQLSIERERNRMVGIENMLRMGKGQGKGDGDVKALLEEQEDLRRATLDQYGQLYKRMEMVNREIASDLPIKPISLLENDEDFAEAGKTIAHSFATFIGDQQNWWEKWDVLPDEQQNKLDNYFKNMKAGLVSVAEENAISLMGDFYANPALMDKIDFSGSPIDTENIYSADYLNSLVRGYNMLENYKTSKDMINKALLSYIGSSVDKVNSLIELEIKEKIKGIPPLPANEPSKK